MDKLLKIAAVAVFLALLVQANQWEYADEKEAERNYCQMVAMYKIDQSKGWPPYNNEIDCEVAQ